MQHNNSSPIADTALDQKWCRDVWRGSKVLELIKWSLEHSRLPLLVFTICLKKLRTNIIMQNSLTIALINKFQFFRRFILFCLFSFYQFSHAENGNDVQIWCSNSCIFSPSRRHLLRYSPPFSKPRRPVNTTPARPHKIEFWMASKIPFFWVYSACTEGEGQW